MRRGISLSLSRRSTWRALYLKSAPHCPRARGEKKPYTALLFPRASAHELQLAAVGLSDCTTRCCCGCENRAAPRVRVECGRLREPGRLPVANGTESRCGSRVIRGAGVRSLWPTSARPGTTSRLGCVRGLFSRGVIVYHSPREEK